MRGIRTPTYPALPECSAVKTSMVAPKFNACREADVETVPGRSPLLTVVPRAINPNPPRDSVFWLLREARSGSIIWHRITEGARSTWS